MVLMEMWKKIETLIDAKGMKWTELARLMGVSDSRISKWRSGVGEVDRKQVLRLAKVLETGVEYLVDDSQEDARQAQALTEDEIFVLKSYRMLRRTKGIDEELAVAGMTSMGMGERVPDRLLSRPMPPPGIDPDYRHPPMPKEPWEGIKDHLPARAEAEAKQSEAGKRSRKTKQG